MALWLALPGQEQNTERRREIISKAVHVFQSNASYFSKALGVNIPDDELERNLNSLGQRNRFPGETYDSRLDRYKSAVRLLTQYIKLEPIQRPEYCTAGSTGICIQCLKPKFFSIPCVGLDLHCELSSIDVDDAHIAECEKVGGGSLTMCVTASFPFYSVLFPIILFGIASALQVCRSRKQYSHHKSVYRDSTNTITGHVHVLASTIRST